MTRDASKERETETLVRSLYEAYPYPAANAGSVTLPELGAMLKLFFLENRVRPRGERLLDVGTGSGNRLLGAAEMVPDLAYTGTDFSNGSIEQARDAAQRLGFPTERTPVEFTVGDVLSDEFVERLGPGWAFITCMGVLHHIPRRERALANIRKLLAPDGYFFVYVYGELGSRDRLLTKSLIRLLRADAADREDGIAVAKALGAGISGYGWQTDHLTRTDRAIEADEATRDISIVDALLHDYEATYTLASLEAVLAEAGFTWLALSGITVDDHALMVRTDWSATSAREASDLYTTSPAIAGSDLLRERYEALPVRGRLEVIETLFKPNGYTIVAGTGQASAERLGRRLRGARIDLG